MKLIELQENDKSAFDTCLKTDGRTNIHIKNIKTHVSSIQNSEFVKHVVPIVQHKPC